MEEFSPDGSHIDRLYCEADLERVMPSREKVNGVTNTSIPSVSWDNFLCTHVTHGVQRTMVIMVLIDISLSQSAFHAFFRRSEFPDHLRNLGKKVMIAKFQSKSGLRPRRGPYRTLFFLLSLGYTPVIAQTTNGAVCLVGT